MKIERPNNRYTNLRKIKMSIEIYKNTSKNLEKLIRDKWPNNITYRGKPFFNMYVVDKNHWIDQVDKHIKQSEYYDGWCQESYLGYIPSKDAFVMGFDGIEEVDSVYVFTVDPKNPKEIKTIKGANISGYIYPHVYKDIHDKYKDIVDIRLD
jgi:hypothetical protein